jgi:membrane protease YdiL (CAAX protease family)
MVFLVYVLAFTGIVAFSIVAAAVMRNLYPEMPEREIFDGLPGLLAGGLASSLALLTTVGTVVRPFDAERLRLRPGRETGTALVVMILGTLALGQTLDSLTMLAGLGNRGAMAVIRRALEGAVGPELFGAVIVIGLMAGSAEELFFRGYMQTQLVARWPPAAAVLVTSLAFAVLHLELIHAGLALVLGLWLGFLTERTGSALPAVVCHVVNNILFTVLTAALGTVDAVRTNALLAAGSGAVFAACLVWLIVWRPSAVAAPP